MPGFLVSNVNKSFKLNNLYNEKCVYENLECAFKVCRNTLNKFLDDKILQENERYIIVTDGVLLNKKTLMEQYQCDSLFALIITMYQQHGIKFPDYFRGGVSGALYDKVENQWHIWTGHVGDNALFYYRCQNQFIVASQVNYILDNIEKNTLTLNEQAVYSMLTYGFMYDDRTYANEIKRIPPGCVLTISDEGIGISRYYVVDNNKIDVSSWSKDDIIDELDRRFRNAVKLEFDKDLEYGYSHLVDLSGGFDCRMTAWVAHDMGYTDCINICYSQSTGNDFPIAQEIAAKLNSTLFFRQMDDAKFLSEIDRLTALSSGVDRYSAITGGEDMLRHMDCDTFGVEHTGLLGDVVISSFVRTEEENTERKMGAMCSEVLKDRVLDEHIFQYPNTEIQKMYIRGFYGACSSVMIRRNYVEVAAPFIDPDVLDFCMSIPLEYRADHKIYNEWIIKKYPGAADIRWSHNDRKITDSKFRGTMRALRYRGWDKICRVLAPKKYVTSYNMNPFDYWYISKPEIRNVMDTYYREHLNCPVLPIAIRRDMECLYANGSAYDKTLVLSAQSALELYFGLF